MAGQGWLKLHRASKDGKPYYETAAWKDAHLWQVWCHCLLRANHADGVVSIKLRRAVQNIPVKAGQFVVGRHSGALELGVSPSAYRRRLLSLERLGYILVKSDTNCSIVTINNWQTYNDPAAKSGQQDAHQNAHQSGAQSVTTSDTDKKLRSKEVKKTEEKLPDASASEVVVQPKPKRKRKTATTKPRPRNPYSDAFEAAFNATFPDKYVSKNGDFVQLAKWRNDYPDVPPERFVEIARKEWGKDEFRSSYSLTIAGMCSGWSMLVAKHSMTGTGEPKADKRKGAPVPNDYQRDVMNADK